VSASAKLAALSGRKYRTVTVPGTEDSVVLHEDALWGAFPEIVAVVEAAEFYFGELRAGRPALTIGIEQALAALDEKLP
jgi:hypothetical protein